MKKINNLILLGILLLSLAACGSEKSDEERAQDMAESIFESVTGNEVDIDMDEDGESGSITIKGKDGEEVTIGGNENEIPSDFPSDVFVVDGTKEAIGVLSTKDNKVVNFVVKTDKEVADLKEEITKEMTSNGWENTMMMGSDQEWMLMYTKNDNSVTLGVAKEGEGAAISYIVSYKK